MREIKFRAWHKNRKTFLDFYWAVDKFGRTFSILDKYVYDEFTDEIELMQYTGLKDVNGVEIYEGDVVKAVPVRKGLRMLVGAIEVEPQLLSVAGQTYDTELYDYEVIGNNFQNPELLEVASK